VCGEDEATVIRLLLPQLTCTFYERAHPVCTHTPTTHPPHTHTHTHDAQLATVTVAAGYQLYSKEKVDEIVAKLDEERQE